MFLIEEIKYLVFNLKDERENIQMKQENMLYISLW